MIKRQYERHWQSVHDLLLVADPKLLDDFKAAKKQQELDRQDHLRMIARKAKARQHLINQLLVGGTTLIVGVAIIAAGFMILLRIYRWVSWKKYSGRSWLAGLQGRRSCSLLVTGSTCHDYGLPTCRCCRQRSTRRAVFLSHGWPLQFYGTHDRVGAVQNGAK